MRFFQGRKYTRSNRIDGKVIIVTGCNTGIGKATVLELAKRGAKIYMACRDIKKCDEARVEIIEQSRNQNIFTRRLDLSSLESVRTFVADFKVQEQRLDILINNAGVAMVPQSKTVDGFESHFGVNHLAHFLLTNLLLDLLIAAAPSRIINVSSDLHSKGIGRLNRDDLNLEQSYGKMKAYCHSKLANILFTRELAKRLNGTGVVANSLHPGIVQTEIGRHNKLLTTITTPISNIFFKTPDAGAQTQIALALDPNFGKISGKYFSDCAVAQESIQAQDDDEAQWLWAISERMTNLNQ